MSRFLRISCISLFAIFLLFGCAATQDITTSLTSKVTSKVTAITSTVDEDLFAQVSEDEKEGVQTAEFDLKVAEERLKLAELKGDRASRQEKLADLKKDRVEKDYKAAALNLDIIKILAIDRAGLGEKEKNIKNIAKLKTKKHETEGDRINIEAKISIVEREIRELDEQIQEQEEIVKNLTTGKGEPEGAIVEPSVTEEDKKVAEPSAEGKGGEGVAEPSEGSHEEIPPPVSEQSNDKEK